ncbi:MAG: hypothetical protein QY323_04815 [Patescibacteria group bacterium]|nr:MAG: hypothetical protein QY323_04815 [Patescibacteria group bacterium]
MRWSMLFLAMLALACTKASPKTTIENRLEGELPPAATLERNRAAVVAVWYGWDDPTTHATQ